MRINSRSTGSTTVNLSSPTSYTPGFSTSGELLPRPSLHDHGFLGHTAHPPIGLGYGGLWALRPTGQPGHTWGQEPTALHRAVPSTREETVHPARRPAILRRVAPTLRRHGPQGDDTQHHPGGGTSPRLRWLRHNDDSDAHRPPAERGNRPGERKPQAEDPGHHCLPANPHGLRPGPIGVGGEAVRGGVQDYTLDTSIA